LDVFCDRRQDDETESLSMDWVVFVESDIAQSHTGFGLLIVRCFYEKFLEVLHATVSFHIPLVTAMAEFEGSRYSLEDFRFEPEILREKVTMISIGEGHIVDCDLHLLQAIVARRVAIIYHRAHLGK
jgi:hypothetical protein